MGTHPIFESDFDCLTDSIKKSLSMGEFKHGICGCFDNLATCCIAYFIPCVTAGQNAEQVGQGSCLVHGILSMIPFVNIFCIAQNRSEVRTAVGIEGNFCSDLMCTCCCPLCVLVQSKNTLDANNIRRT